MWQYNFTHAYICISMRTKYKTQHMNDEYSWAVWVYIQNRILLKRADNIPYHLYNILVKMLYTSCWVITQCYTSGHAQPCNTWGHTDQMYNILASMLCYYISWNNLHFVKHLNAAMFLFSTPTPTLVILCGRALYTRPGYRMVECGYKEYTWNHLEVPFLCE